MTEPVALAFGYIVFRRFNKIIDFLLRDTNARLHVSFYETLHQQFLLYVVTETIVMESLFAQSLSEALCIHVVILRNLFQCIVYASYIHNNTQLARVLTKYFPIDQIIKQTLFDDIIGGKVLVVCLCLPFKKL